VIYSPQRGKKMSTSLLNGPDQYDAFQDVQARLTRDFAAGVPAPVVEDVVQRWVRSFEGARVTLYLPILVERASRAELSHLGAQGDRAVGDDAGSVGIPHAPT
jgi:hypothetical protein